MCAGLNPGAGVGFKAAEVAGLLKSHAFSGKFPGFSRVAQGLLNWERSKRPLEVPFTDEQPDHRNAQGALFARHVHGSTGAGLPALAKGSKLADLRFLHRDGL